MERLLNDIAALAEILSFDRMGSLSSAISAAQAGSIRAHIEDMPVPPAARGLMRSVADRSETLALSQRELAGMIAAAGVSYDRAKKSQSLEFVWTGPKTEYVSPRMTEQVLLEVINASSERLFIVSFVAYRIPSLIEAISAALERGVDVSILLELSEEQGGAVKGDSLRRIADVLPRAKLYLWKGREEFQRGRVHAKIAVADGRICLVSSANLTGYALERNMEAGILVRGEGLPTDLHHHLDSLVITKTIQET